MRRNAGSILFALAVGYALAHFVTAFYNHWYFADWFWPKVGIVALLIAVAYGLALATEWGKVLRGVGVWWIVTHLLAMIPAGGPDLRNLAFVAVLDFEVAVVWVPGAALLVFWLYTRFEAGRERRKASHRIDSELRLRRRLRRQAARTGPQRVAAITGESGQGE